MELLLIVAIGLGTAFLVYRWGGVVTVYEYERGLRYVGGRFRGVVEPGRHWFVPFHETIHKVDVRPRVVIVPGQEVLTRDGVSLKVTVAAEYAVVDPDRAVNSVQSFVEALYLRLQVALREIIGAADIDALLKDREGLGGKLLEKTAESAGDLGLGLASVSIRDLMFPGRLKETFAQVVHARKEGEAALERARGETAALRNLANAAKMLDKNPGLVQLRILQAVGESSGNTVVFGAPDVAASGVASKPSAARD